MGLLFVRIKHKKIPHHHENNGALSSPPPDRRIIIVGFLPDNNGRACALHPFGCGNIVVLERADGGVGMLVRLRMLVRDELACFAINPDGSDGCRVAFAAGEYAAGEMGEAMTVRLSVS